MKTITFYSYKGGVGRSLALANVATRLAEFGKKVCLLDFDLEAPGLHFKFTNFLSPKRIGKGIVDYVSEYVEDGIIPTNIKDYAIEFPVIKNGKSIHLIPAGKIEATEYWKKLSGINWYDLLYENDNGLLFFLDLKEKIKRDINPDFLLIDSRTGISEISGITLSLLADEVVVVAANNKENLDGAKRIINAITDPENVIMERIPKINFVLSRVPFTDKPEEKNKEIVLLNKIRREYLNTKTEIDITVIHSDRELEENERIKIAYEKDESVTQIGKDYLLLFERLTRDDLSQDEINKFNIIRESEKYFSRAMAAGSVFERVDFLNKAIEKNANNIDLYVFRAQANTLLKKYEEGLKDLEIAKELNEKYLPALTVKVEILSRQQRFEEAENVNLSLLELDAYNHFGFYMAGVLSMGRGNIKAAINQLGFAILVYPEAPDLYNARACARRMNKEFSLALDDVYKALELDSNFGVAYGTLAEINYDMSNMREFYLHMETAFKLNKEDMQELILSDPFYRSSFLIEDDRFNALLNKYDIPGFA